MYDFTLTPMIWSVMIVLAAIIDFIFGDPQFLVHPVILIGKLIGCLKGYLNKGGNRKFKGLILVILTLTVTGGITFFLEQLFYKINIFVYLILLVWFLSTMLAEKSLYLAGHKCEAALKSGDLNRARKYTGEIVGRQTEGLSKDEIIRAVVETEAENGIDGILAPLTFMFLGVFLIRFNAFLNPLVLVILYKTVNTLDSMVGYIYEPYKDFGYFSAKLDDVLNWIPARIGSLFILLAGWILHYPFKEGFKIFFRDRLNHLSPNSAHAESAVAGLLGIQLGGANTYFGHVTNKPSIGDKKRDLRISDIGKTMKIVAWSEVLYILFCLLCVFLYNLNF